MRDIESIKNEVTRIRAIEILEEMKTNLIQNTSSTITKAFALDMAINSLKGNWKDCKKEKPEQYIHIVIWDDSIKAIGEAYWDGNYFKWVCDDMIANATLWKEYELPIENEAD